MNARLLLRLLGPVLFGLALILPTPEGMTDAARLTAGVTLWLAVWWVTEAVHPAVTALLPLILFPLCGVMPIKAVAPEYSNEIIYLFMAGFFIGKAIERWHLHRRIALQMVAWLGTNPPRIILGFMLATGFISMWISNTVTAVMMTPVAVAVAVGQSAGDGKEHGNFSKALLLGVGYAASIGGMGTLVGTPTNAIFAAFGQQHHLLGPDIFTRWLWVGFPYAVLLLVACWWLLLRLFPQEKNAASTERHAATLDAELRMLGPISAAEWRVLAVFAVVVVAWLTGSLVWYRWLPGCNDTVVALGGAIVLFLLPSGTGSAPRTPLLDWNTANDIPWSVIVFFGGGLALAKGFEQSGLATWLGNQLVALQHFPVWVIALFTFVLVVLLSEVASNIATATMMMPVLLGVAQATGVEPTGLLLTATIAASAGFGLPVANAANSIVYATGVLDSRDMARAGFALDVVAILLLLGAYLLRI